MIGLHTLIFAGAASFLLSTYTLLINYGPILESILFPVISIKAVGASARVAQSENPPQVRIDRIGVGGDLKGRVCFRLDMMKYRACQVDEFHWDWQFNSTTEVAEVTNAVTNTPFRPQTTIITGPALSQAICADLPKVSYSYREIALKGTLVYEHCGFFHRQFHQVLIPIKIDGPLQQDIPEVETEEMK